MAHVDGGSISRASSGSLRFRSSMLAQHCGHMHPTLRLDSTIVGGDNHAILEPSILSHAVTLQKCAKMYALEMTEFYLI